jgi:hypothetical protein
MALEIGGAPRLGRTGRQGADQAVLADLGAVEDDGAHADQAASADRAAMEDRAMTDRDAFANRQRITRIAVEDRAILDVGAGADAYRGIVVADGGAEPEAGAGSNDDVADDVGGRRDEGVREKDGWACPMLQSGIADPPFENLCLDRSLGDLAIGGVRQGVPEQDLAGQRVGGKSSTKGMRSTAIPRGPAMVLSAIRWPPTN